MQKTKIENIEKVIHSMGEYQIMIIGCGSTGSQLALSLVKMGFEKFILCDFDKVENHNIANQIFAKNHIDCYKATALQNILSQHNSNISTRVETRPIGEPFVNFTGITSPFLIPSTEPKAKLIVFLCVDGIATRKKIISSVISQYKNLYYLCDPRIGLNGGQINTGLPEEILKTLDYTDLDVKIKTPVSACGLALGNYLCAAQISVLMVAQLLSFIENKDTLGKLRRMEFDWTYPCKISEEF
jgi:hypothetical protein